MSPARLVRHLVAVGAVLLVTTVATPVLANGTTTREAILQGGGPVAVDGDTLITGSTVYTRRGTAWSQQASSGPLNPPAIDLPLTGLPSARYAVRSVAIDGDTAVLGLVEDFTTDAPNRGMAIVFARAGSGWVEQARLSGTDPNTGDDFGGTVDISGDTIAVGAIGDSSAAMWSGAAHIFRRTGATWARQALITRSGAQASDFFGRVALDGDTLVVGATGANAAYVFTRGNARWTQQATLVPTPASTLFGWSVDVAGDVAVVGALRDSTTAPSAGAAFVFTRSGTTWRQVAKLVAGDAAADHLFGSDVTVDGDRIVVTRSGLGGEADPGPGAAYLFELVAGTWQETAMLRSATPAAADNFGISAALDGGTIAVSAPTGTTPQTYVFHLGMARPGEHIGLVDTSSGLWYLLNTGGIVPMPFYYGNPGDAPFMGDWNCDGVDTPGLYRQSDGFVYLRNSSGAGFADIRFFFGNPGDIPLAGDFNGDGCDTVSLYRPGEGRAFIINRLGSDAAGLGAADTSYYFGNPSDKPFVGDFDGDGVDTLGLHRETTGLVYVRNSHTQGVADLSFIFGDPGDRMMAGDWLRSGTDTPALFRPADSTFYFRYSNTQGVADDRVTWGRGSWVPVHGWFGLFDFFPTDDTLPPAHAAMFAEAFLAARVAGSGAEAFLSPIAAAQYADPAGGLALYAAYEAAGVVTADQVDPSSYELTVQLHGPGGTVREVLFVGRIVGGAPGVTGVGLEVRGAMRLP